MRERKSFSESNSDEQSDWDSAGWVRNGIFTKVACASGASSGSDTFTVAVGDTFGFGAMTYDGAYGSATAIFTNLVLSPL